MAFSGLAAPHGPDVSGRHPSMVNPVFQMNEDESRTFQRLLKPDDSYDENGIYWADMNWFKRARFVLHTDSIETKREAGNVWRMFKQDPLSPVAYYFRNMVSNSPSDGSSTAGLSYRLLTSLGLDRGRSWS